MAQTVLLHHFCQLAFHTFLANNITKLAWVRRLKAGKKIDVACLSLGRARILHLPGELAELDRRRPAPGVRRVLDHQHDRDEHTRLRDEPVDLLVRHEGAVGEPSTGHRQALPAISVRVKPDVREAAIRVVELHGRHAEVRQHSVDTADLAGVEDGGQLPVIRMHELDAITELQPNGYTGTPSFLRILIEKAVETGTDIHSLTKASVGGEACPPSLTAWFKQQGVAVYQTYATADLGMVAYETAAREGLVLDEGVIVEIVRPGTGSHSPLRQSRTCPPGCASSSRVSTRQNSLISLVEPSP